MLFKDQHQMLNAAISLAIALHAPQKDKAGLPYILHPLTVMLDMETNLERTVAVLHDTVEDTGYSLESCRDMFGNEVADAIDAISRRPGEQYFDYIKRCKLNPLATKVKLADLKHNSSPARINVLPEKDRDVVKRYEKAVRLLDGGWAPNSVLAGYESRINENGNLETRPISGSRSLILDRLVAEIKNLPEKESPGEAEPSK